MLQNVIRIIYIIDKMNIHQINILISVNLTLITRKHRQSIHMQLSTYVHVK